MTNVELVAKINNGSCLLGEGIILKPDGSVADADGRQLMPPDETRAGMYTTTAAEKAVMNELPSKVEAFEPDVVIKLDKSVNDDTLANQDIHVEHGIWYDINNKLLQGKPVKAEVYSVYTVSGEEIDAPSDALVTARGTADTAGIAIEGWEGNELIINVTMETGGVTLRMNRTGVIIG